MTLSHGQFLAALVRQFPGRIIDTWLQEFGYADLNKAVVERGARLGRELDLHAKRLADRAQMQSAPIVGRARFIR